MSTQKKNWHPNFIKYMDSIVKHPNYEDMPSKFKNDGSFNWITTKKSTIGIERLEWCEKKARDFGYPIQPGVYAKVMRKIHPTGWKVCQICGRSMSIYYHYPTKNLIKSLQDTFNITFYKTDHINDIWESLISNNIPYNTITNFFLKKFNLNFSPKFLNKEVLIDTLEKECRIKGKKYLSPGAMSNFPDRLDGFHSYNLCCRTSEDKGRSPENLKAYTKDRRAYEYLSDGNIHAANQFMGSSFFHGTSADHIGPISLGFIHDPLYLQPMSSSDNSAKRDRLTYEDIEKIVKIHNCTKKNPMSWYSRTIWNHIENSYKNKPQTIIENYRIILKQNMANFMHILYTILANCQEQGKIFIEKRLLDKNAHCFHYSYKFDNFGNIIEKKPRHITERVRNEMSRYLRIAIFSIYDYNEKENRNIKINLTEEEYTHLIDLCDLINHQSICANFRFEQIIQDIQNRIIRNL